MMDRNSIPEEILFEILTMLPVKSLCRFRCVSKSWFTIISNPNFVDAHLARSNSRPKLLISLSKGRPLGSNLPSGYQNYLFSIDYPKEEDDDDLSAKPLRLHATAHGSVNCQCAKPLLSSSSGLICCTWPEGIRIGNPITRDFDLIQYPFTRDHRDFSVSSFLGFDPVDKRHVMLKVEASYGCFGSPAKINVVSLPERQCHEISPHCISDGGHWITMGGDYSICINGVIYFTAWAHFPDSPNYTYLNAFDVRLEFIERIQDPPDRNGMYSALTEYTGRIACVGYWHSFFPSHNPYLDEMKFWVLDDPKKQSWSVKSFVVPWGRSQWKHSTKFSGVTTPRGDLIFATALPKGGGSIEMFLYNIHTNTLRRFEIDGFGPIPRNYRLARFKFLIESLHSPKRRQLSIP